MPQLVAEQCEEVGANEVLSVTQRDNEMMTLMHKSAVSKIKNICVKNMQNAFSPNAFRSVPLKSFIKEMLLRCTKVLLLTGEINKDDLFSSRPC